MIIIHVLILTIIVTVAEAILQLASGLAEDTEQHVH